jgi:hypothetical protein
LWDESDFIVALPLARTNHDQQEDEKRDDGASGKRLNQR